MCRRMLPFPAERRVARLRRERPGGHHDAVGPVLHVQLPQGEAVCGAAAARARIGHGTPLGNTALPDKVNHLCAGRRQLRHQKKLSNRSNDRLPVRGAGFEGLPPGRGAGGARRPCAASARPRGHPGSVVTRPVRDNDRSQRVHRRRSGAARLPFPHGGPGTTRRWVAASCSATDHDTVSALLLPGATGVPPASATAVCATTCSAGPGRSARSRYHCTAGSACSSSEAATSRAARSGVRVPRAKNTWGG